jgi:hypothetical protein
MVGQQAREDAVRGALGDEERLVLLAVLLPRSTRTLAAERASASRNSGGGSRDDGGSCFVVLGLGLRPNLASPEAADP